jgi:hypothetical protein
VTVPAPWPLLHRRPYMLHGCCPSSIPPERRPPELDSAAEDLAQARFTREDAATRESRGRRQAPLLGPPPSTSSCFIRAGAGGELRRGLRNFSSSRFLLHPACRGRSRRTPPLGPTAQPSPGPLPTAPLELRRDRGLRPRHSVRCCLSAPRSVCHDRPLRLPTPAAGPAPRTPRMRKGGREMR